MRRTLEDVLLEAGLTDEPALKLARRRARKTGVALVRAVVEEGVGDEAIARALAERLGLPRADLAGPVDADAVREVPYELADGRRLLPLSIDRGGARAVIRVAMADPLDRDAVEEIELSTGCTVDPLVAASGELDDAVQRHYRGVITQMIRRRPVFGAPADAPAPGDAGPRAIEPSTQPIHHIADEAPPEVRLEVLVDLLIERGLIDRDAWGEALRRALKARAGE